MHRMLRASNASATARASAIPVIEGARELAAAGQIPGGSKRNRSYVEPAVDFAPEVDEVTRVLLTDAQTSGGLLISCPAENAERLEKELTARGLPSLPIGTVGDGAAGVISVEA
jgi:selenide,water dikinase